MPRKNSFITVTDQFCGAGGSSQGVRKAAQKIGGGLEVKLALNHWKLAIETHNTNFPETLHDCTDISACDPRRYPSSDILITSPECTNHSLAKGTKKKGLAQMDLFNTNKLDPSAERSRATMWDVPRFAEYHSYNIIIVENVVDARHWVMFDAWIHAMHLLGYMHKCVYINSMHCWPTPQSRDRMYVVFWKKGNKAPDLNFTPKAFCLRCAIEINAIQSWKDTKVKYGKYGKQYIYCCPVCTEKVEPYYYAAFNCIDWTIPGKRIGDRKKPLAANSERRIKVGLEKYGNKPLIITGRYTSGIEHRVRDAFNHTLPTQPGDSSHAILNPYLVSMSHTHAGDNRSYSAALPINTQCTKNSTGVVVPYIIEMNRTGNARSVDNPLSTVLAGGNHHGLIQSPFIVEGKGQSNARSILDRLGCLTTKINYGLVSTEALNTFLAYNYRGNQTSHITEAVDTIPTVDRVSIIQYDKAPAYEDCTFRMLLPHEVQRAMAFDDDYVILGNGAEKVKQCGNAVTPPAMEWLVERCIQSLN